MGSGVAGRKVRVGTVKSAGMDKTVVVKVDRRVTTRRYKKIVTRSTTFKAHDPENACKSGDTVRIVETRPLSKEKRWRVLEIVKKAQ